MHDLFLHDSPILTVVESHVSGLLVVRVLICSKSDVDTVGVKIVCTVSNDGLFSPTKLLFGARYSITSSAFVLSTIGFSGSGGFSFE